MRYYITYLIRYLPNYYCMTSDERVAVWDCIWKRGRTRCSTFTACVKARMSRGPMLHSTVQVLFRYRVQSTDLGNRYYMGRKYPNPKQSFTNVQSQILLSTKIIKSFNCQTQDFSLGFAFEYLQVQLPKVILIHTTEVFFSFYFLYPINNKIIRKVRFYSSKN